MRISRTVVAVLGAAALAAAAITVQSAHAHAPVTLNVLQASGECSVSWKNPGLTLKATDPGHDSSSYALTNGAGTVTIDLGQAADPVALAQSVSVGGSFSGGFTLTDASGRSLTVSDGQGTLPTGGATYLVKTPAAPAGTRLPVYTYESPAVLVPQVSSVLPPKVGVEVPEVKVAVAPEFAQAVNDTFGPGTVADGTPFGTCTATITT
ncbi:hypothetical protein [Streptomyces sp. I05A-00742]|uniref:hypothetical protein n=1 Tax=Streptomyces sp. I05A-00742 TaxID=2732853 RepID=UPI001488926A|nr:hypothetical protein [Streptomyces sp. I05A-00742]